MNVMRISGLMLVLVGVVALTGCQKPNLDEMMKAPDRPVEYERLGDFVGTWEGSGQMEMMDQEITTEGTESFEWAADGWVLLSRYEYKMGEQVMKGVGVWTWDDKAHKYRVWSFSNGGAVETGWAKYDPATKHWKMGFKGRDTVKGAHWRGKGGMTFTSPDRQEWEWNGYDRLGLFKVMEGTGVSERK